MTGCASGYSSPGASEGRNDSLLSDQQQAISDAYDACADSEVGNPYGGDMVPASTVLTLSDSSIVIDGADDEYLSGPAADCVTAALGVDAATMSMINSTTSLMGRQTATNGDFTYTWSFHPDNGLDMVIETP